MKITKTVISCLVIGGTIGYFVNQSLSPLASIDVSGQLDLALQKDKAIVDLYRQIDIEKAKVTSLISDIHDLHLQPKNTTGSIVSLENKGSLELLNLLHSMQKHANEDDRYLTALILQKLDALLHDNQVSLDEALNELTHYAGTSTGELLIDALSSINDPRVEVAAQQLISPANSEEQRIAGFKLLSRMHSKSPVTREFIVQILITEQDPEIIGIALYALTPAIVTDNQHREIIDILTILTHSLDEKIRAQSSIVLAEWAVSDDELQAVINKTQDPSSNVRAQAAFALGITKLKTEKSKQALIDLISESEENFIVRKNAWDALNGYPIAEGDILSYRELEVEFEDNEQYSEGITEIQVLELY